MPYVELGADFSLYYEFVRPFDASLPTMVCLSPYMHSITLLSPLLNEPAFQSWNQVLIDLPYNGRGEAPIDPSYDHAVAAALVAFAIEKLSLPGCHFYAPEVAAFHTATFLSVLFPECVLSLSFAGVYSLFAPQDGAVKIFGEIDNFIVSSANGDDFVDGITALIDTCLGDCSSYEPEWVERVTDTMGSIFVNRYNPRYVRYLLHTTAFRQPHRLGPEHLARITVPVLVIHGEEDVAHPVQVAHEFYDAMVGSPRRELWIVPGAPHCVDLTHERQVTARLVAFLAPFKSAPVPIAKVDLNRCKALHTLADVTSDLSVLSRNTSLAQSFTSQSPSTLSRITHLFASEQSRADSYNLDIHLEGVSQPWEVPRPCEWTYTRRHDRPCLVVQELQAVRRASGGLVEVLTDTKVVKERDEEDWYVAREPTEETIELKSAISCLETLSVA